MMDNKDIEGGATCIFFAGIFQAPLLVFVTFSEQTTWQSTGAVGTSPPDETHS